MTPYWAGRMGQRYPEIVSHLGWTLAGVSDNQMRLQSGLTHKHVKAVFMHQ